MVATDRRHGARSPLTKRYWAGQEWDVCGSAFEPVALEITSLDGGAQPQSDHDQAQVTLDSTGMAHHIKPKAVQGDAVSVLKIAP